MRSRSCAPVGDPRNSCPRVGRRRGALGQLQSRSTRAGRAVLRSKGEFTLKPQSKPSVSPKDRHSLAGRQGSFYPTGRRLEGAPEEGCQQTGHEVCDAIAGMTDLFALDEHALSV
ncbi:hypothetical protein [Pararhodospirillum photometricum]|uniref:hypothetical protein n=1 Tax=Pararhodospirillum photometricum TaxID=1084 RepID=UPI003BB5C7AE